MRSLIPRPEDFTSAARGPATSARVGVWLGVAFTACFVTGFWSHLQYAPPAGKAGAWVATLLGANPSRQIRKDLRRLKQRLEAGATSRARPETSPDTAAALGV